MSKITDNVTQSIEPIVTSLGYEIVDVTYEKRFDGYNLTVFIDSKDGISLDDCEKVHVAIDAKLDELDPTNGESYILNVSSPGLDRPIKSNKDLERNVGVVLEASLYSATRKCKNYVGKLVAYNDTAITLETPKGDIELDRTNIAKLCKYIEF